MSRKIIHTDRAPKAIGPYSQAVAAGGLVFLSGQVGLDPKSGEIVAWLADDYGLGRGHAMALVHVITKGDKISTTHVGTGTAHSDPSDTLWLDGKATHPAG